MIEALTTVAVFYIFITLILMMIGGHHYTKDDFKRTLPKKEGEPGIVYLVRGYAIIQYHGILGVGWGLKIAIRGIASRLRWLFIGDNVEENDE